MIDEILKHLSVYTDDVNYFSEDEGHQLVKALRLAVKYIESNRIAQHQHFSGHDRVFNDELDEALVEIATILCVKEGEK